jgi:hypothetical protein
MEEVEEVEPVPPPYDINRVHDRPLFARRRLTEFRGGVAREEVYEVNVGDAWDGRRILDLGDELHHMWADLLLHIQNQGVAPDDRIRIHIKHGALNLGAIRVKLRRFDEMNPQAIMDRVAEVLNSHQEIVIDESLEILIGIIRIPRGEGRTQVSRLSGKNNSLTTKRSVVEIKNNDNLCMARAIAVGLGRLKKDANQMTEDEYRQLRNHRKKKQEKAALDLHARAGVPTDRPCTLNDISKFEEVEKVQVIVLSAERGNNTIYVGHQSRDKKVFLYLVPSEDQN